MADIKSYFDQNAKIKHKTPVKKPTGKVKGETLYAKDMVDKITKLLGDASSLPNKDLLPFLQSKLFANNGALLKHLPRTNLKDVYNIMNDMITNLANANDRLGDFVATGREYQSVFDGIADIVTAQENVQQDGFDEKINDLTNEQDLPLIRAFEFMGVPLDRGSDGKWVRDPSKTNDLGVKINGHGVMTEESINAFLNNYLNVDPALRKEEITPAQLFKYYLSQIAAQNPNINNTIMNMYRAQYNENNPEFINLGSAVQKADLYQQQEQLRSSVMDDIEHLKEGLTEGDIENYGFISPKSAKALASLEKWASGSYDQIDDKFNDFYDQEEVVKDLEAEKKRLETQYKRAEALEGNEAESQINSIKDRLNAVKQGLHAVSGMEQKEQNTDEGIEVEKEEMTDDEHLLFGTDIMLEFSDIYEKVFRNDLAYETSEFFVGDEEFLGQQYKKYSDEYLRQKPDAQPQEIIDSFMDAMGEKPSENEPSVLEQLNEQDGIMLGTPETIKSALYRKHGIEDPSKDNHDKLFTNLMVSMNRVARIISQNEDLYNRYMTGDENAKKQVVSEAIDLYKANGNDINSQPPTSEELLFAKAAMSSARTQGTLANLENVQDADNPLANGYRRFYQDLLGKSDEHVNNWKKATGQLVNDGPNHEAESENKKKEDRWTTYGKMHPSEGSLTKLQKRLKPYNTKDVIKWMESIIGSFDKIKVKIVDKTKKHYFDEPSKYNNENTPQDNQENLSPEEVKSAESPDEEKSGEIVVNDPYGQENQKKNEETAPEETKEQSQEPAPEQMSKVDRKTFAIASLPAFSILDGYVKNLEKIAEAKGMDPNSVVEIQQSKDVRFLIQYVSTLNNDNPSLYGDASQMGMTGDLRNVVQMYIEDLISGKPTNVDDLAIWADQLGVQDKNIIAQLQNGLKILATSSANAENTQGEKQEVSGLACALYGFSSDIVQTENGEWQAKIGTKISPEFYKKFAEAESDSARWKLADEYIEATFKNQIADMHWLNTVVEDASKNGESKLNQYENMSHSVELFSIMSTRLIEAMKKEKENNAPDQDATPETDSSVEEMGN